MNQMTRKAIKSLLLITALWLPLISFAENLGVYGQIYTIIEPDFLSFIHQKLALYQQNGKLSKMEDNFKKKAQNAILNPTPVAGISDAKTGDHAIQFDYTPSITIQNNIVDQNGKVLFYRGTTINPLDQKSISKISSNFMVPVFNETLFFINANNTAQVNFVKNNVAMLLKNNPDALYKIILVAGNLKTASASLGRIYFDQGGVLCHQFGIKRVPAVVTLDPKHSASLKIVEPVL